MRSSLGVAILALMLVAADDAKPAPRIDAEAILGTWKVVGLQLKGEKIKEEEFKDFKWTFDSAKLKWSDGQDFLYTLDPTKEPKEIDLRFPENADPNEIIEGIYSLDGDTLKICYGPGERPTKLVAEAGTKDRLITLARVKEKK